MTEPPAERIARQTRKIALGMLSSQLQRTEKAITGRAPRGPPALSEDPDNFMLVMPHPPKAEKKPRRPVQTPESHPPSLESGTDLLWHDQFPQPPPGPKLNKRGLSRFLPSHNKGKGTSPQALAKIAAKRADSAFERHYASRPPARLAVKLSPEVVAMCKVRASTSAPMPNARRSGEHPFPTLTCIRGRRPLLAHAVLALVLSIYLHT